MSTPRRAASPDEPGGRPLSPAAVATGPDALAGHAWLVEAFVRRTPGVTHAQVATADGLVLAASAREPADRSDRLAAVAAGLTSIAHAAAHVVGGHLLQTTIEIDTGLVVVRPLPGRGSGTVLALTRPDADPDDIGYELTLLARRIHRALGDGGPADHPGPPAVTPLR
ncbi:MAG: roadblock/LC7 domain-containing protein [Kineosporiaceae bacterium]